MIKIKITIVILFISLGSLFAQAFIYNGITSNNNSSRVTDIRNLKILAVMVEFQKDKFNLTQGDGTFGTIYTKDYGNKIIDPLPHDANYFADHLRFAQNYFTKVSNGNLNIEYLVLPNKVTVSKVMRDYSPKENEGFKPLADFSKEVWQLAIGQNPSVDFSQYNLFAIFHAGVGKDISTNNLLGEARDLPSIYFSLDSYKEYFGNSFTGFPTNNGTSITNTMILPETESREEKGIGESTLLELSINGLLVSSIASHLGLPDLFNAENGKSAIGRFGLMDGQSLFAYKGLFPPEPSAWEKVFLGWEDPKVINSTQKSIEVFAKQIAQGSEARIIKVPINSTEYYLIENRQRDANKDGIKITYKVAGVIKSLTLPKDTLSFNNSYTDTINGVVIDIDEFDWAVPGNGILIWHIDEKVIKENLAINKINANNKRRGVDLEEADGIQDIGEEFQTIFGTTVIAEGDEFDFWYSGNKSELYKNEFTPLTKPNTNTNDGANSLIYFSNFSLIANKMTFDLKIGNEKIELVGTNKLNLTSQPIDIKQSNKDNFEYWFLSGSTLNKIDTSLTFQYSQNNFSENNFVSFFVNGKNFLFGTAERKLNTLVDDGTTTYSLEGDFILEHFASAPIVYQKGGDIIKLYVGMQNGRVAVFDFDISNETLVLQTVVDLFNPMMNQVIVNNGNLITVSDKKITNGSKEIIFQDIIKKVVVTKNSNDEEIFVVATKGKKFFVVKDYTIQNEFAVESSDSMSDFSVADISQDGENYILFQSGNKLNAINLEGSIADNFPIKQNSVSKFISYPLVADINEDGTPDIISTSNNGLIFAYSASDGSLLEGFPLSLGENFSGTQSIVKRDNDLLLTSFTANNTFYSWSIKSSGKVFWGNEFGNNQNNAFVESASVDNKITTFFPKERTYNWPNPVYDNQTFIRTYVAEDSKITIRIFDLSGDLVDILEYNATGGFDNEIAWNVNNIQSGAYIAQVEVKSNSGKTDSKVIKIAVVK